MHKWIIFIFIGFLGIGTYSCQAPEKPKPVDFIEEGDMVMILKDICKVEARFQRRLSIRGKNHSDLVFENYKLIFDEHNVSLDQFKTSYTYYQDSPEQMQNLYDSVIVILTKEQSVLEIEGAKDIKPVDTKK